MSCSASCAVVARYPYMPRLREVDDFLWATVDIAIWSTVEQGLAITAGSLATLRPLFKHIGYSLGLTTRPSDYAAGGTAGYAGHTGGPASHARSRKMSRSGLDDFSGRSGQFSQLSDEEARIGSSAGGNTIPLSKVEVRITAGSRNHQNGSSGSGGDRLRAMSEKNESEEELRTGNQKVVQPTSFVSDDERR